MNSRCFVTAAALAAMSIGAAAAASAAAPSPTGVTPSLPAALAAHSLRAGEIVRLPFAPIAGESYVAPLMYDGGFGVLELDPVSIRSDAFMVYEAGADGELVPVEFDDVRTVRGTLVGTRNAQVAGSIVAGGIEAILQFDDGTRLAIEPVGRHFPGADALMHVVYDPADAESDGFACGADGSMRVRGPITRGDLADPVEGGALQIAELACDADYEYYLDYGSSAAVVARIESVINTMNLQYESEVGISHSITTILVRTTSNDPYSSSDAVTLLNQFRNHWNSSQGSIQRDVAQLFTGKEVNGGTIGIAWLSAICSSYGYGVVQSDFNGNFASATDLSAHELGHNWSADHCSCTSYTMNPYITSANTFSPTFTRNDITSFRDSIGCLDVDGGGGGGGGGGNDPVDLTPDSFNITKGSLAGGNLASLADSDNNRLLVQSAAQGNKQKTDIQIYLGGASSTGTIDLSFEISCSTNAKAQLRVFNYGNNRWTRLGRITMPSGDTIYTADGLSAASYVNGSGEVRVRIDTNKRNVAHQLRIDRVGAVSTP